MSQSARDLGITGDNATMTITAVDSGASAVNEG